MRVIYPGHTYELDHLDVGTADINCDPTILRFVKRIGEKFPGNSGPSVSGTTTQEVIRALLDRTQYVNRQRPDPTNYRVIKSLRSALVDLEIRAARERGDSDSVESIMLMTHPETWPTCAGCGHLCCSRSECLK